MTRTLTAALAAFLVMGSCAQAAYDCGRYMRHRHGIKDPCFNLALCWAKLPHTTAHPGAIVVQTRKGRALGGGPGGHVSEIVRPTGHCRAIVRDNRGTYERDICSRLVAYVSPGGRRTAQADWSNSH